MRVGTSAPAQLGLQIRVDAGRALTVAEPAPLDPKRGEAELRQRLHEPQSGMPELLDVLLREPVRGREDPRCGERRRTRRERPQGSQPIPLQGDDLAEFDTAAGQRFQGEGVERTRHQPLVELQGTCVAHPKPADDVADAVEVVDLRAIDREQSRPHSNPSAQRTALRQRHHDEPRAALG